MYVRSLISSASGLRVVGIISVGGGRLLNCGREKVSKNIKQGGKLAYLKFFGIEVCKQVTTGGDIRESWWSCTNTSSLAGWLGMR